MGQSCPVVSVTTVPVESSVLHHLLSSCTEGGLGAGIPVFHRKPFLFNTSSAIFSRSLKSVITFALNMPMNIVLSTLKSLIIYKVTGH